MLSFFILSLLFVILTMDTLSEINLMDGWVESARLLGLCVDIAMDLL